MSSQSAHTSNINLSNQATNGTITLQNSEDTTTTTLNVAEGFEGIPRQQNNINNSALLIFLIFSLFTIFVAITRRKVSLRTIISNKEESKEEVRHTIIDHIITLSLCTITIISYAITIIYQTTAQPLLTLKHTMAISGAIALVIAFQQIALMIIGKIFFTHNETKQFLKENIIYYTLPAIILTPVIISHTLIYLDNNILTYSMLSLLFLVRLIYIFKNIKKFKQNISTTCYIILYLCTVEIMPIAIINKWILTF